MHICHHRLAAFICGYEVFQISVSSTYGVANFKENLLQLYTKVQLFPNAHLKILGSACVYLFQQCKLAKS